MLLHEFNMTISLLAIQLPTTKLGHVHVQFVSPKGSLRASMLLPAGSEPADHGQNLQAVISADGKFVFTSATKIQETQRVCS